MDKNHFEMILKHPFATAMLITCVANAIASVIAATRGASENKE